MRGVVVLLVVAVLVGAAGSSRGHQAIQAAEGPTFVPKYFTQRLDHFDPLNTQTWKQLFYEDASKLREGGPIFFLLVPEAPMEFFFTSFPQYYETWKLAQDNQGAFVALNHRYYGNNPPGAQEMTAENLRFLSVEQALEDYITFADGLSAQRGWKTNPWIVTGISYSGALAAYTRLKYPQKFVAAYASSGVVQAIEVLYQYGQAFVEAVSPACYNPIASAIKYMDDGMDKPEIRAEMEAKFNPCGSLHDDDNFVRFLYQLSGDVIGSAQEAEQEEVCKFFVNGTDPVQSFANFARDGLNETQCLDIFNIKDIQRTDWEYASANIRPWYWQKCSEFGYFKLAPPSGVSVVSRWNTLDLHLKWCEQIFQKPTATLHPTADLINERYGGWDTKATNIIFVNGGVDPWRKCSILQPIPSQNIDAYVTTGAGHGAETFPPKDTDPPQLKEARVRIQKFLEQFF